MRFMMIIRSHAPKLSHVFQSLTLLWLCRLEPNLMDDQKSALKSLIKIQKKNPKN
jgi:hypothetical protein